MNRSALVACLSVMCLGLVAGCSSVLGLDAPTLDPCATGSGCLDAGDERSEAGPEEGPEAAPACDWDGAVPAVGTGVRCGGGCNPVVYCSGGTPVCCQTTDDAGMVAFACASNEGGACGGYAIQCVNENDCSGSDVCCHYMAHMICDTACTSSADIACVPGSTQDCPTGKKCDVRLTNEGVAAPYYACEP